MYLAMSHKHCYLLCLSLFVGLQSRAQSPQDASVPLQTAIGVNPASVLINWPAPASPSDITLRRRTKGQPGNTWVTLLNEPQTLTSGYFDSGVQPTETYEYALERKTGNLTARGHAFASFFTPAVDTRGKILVFIDSTTADQLGADLIQFKNDLRGEGWQPVPFKTGNFTTVQWVKNQIVNAYNTDPNTVKAILLIGSVPVPYSGSTAWDNRPDHIGAWPCDAYYGDVNGTWTDNIVNLPNTPRAANRNVPNDGKFDQNTLPSAVEIPVGRLDFRRLSAATFGMPPVEILRQYLFKNHRWRLGQYPAPRRALVDDHLGWSSGEAFAADGYRNAYPLVGTDQVVASDWPTQPNAPRYLLGYGAASPSTYTSAGGIGTSASFATDSVQVVFASLFGDYFGDWDYETNPLLPALLASKGGTLACAWAGRPHWFTQGLAIGETTGFCLKETQNAQFNAAFGDSAGESGTHIALLGDPTLRVLVVAPPTNLVANSNCNKVNLNWTASTDPNIQGYLVYRAFGQDGPYARITPNPVGGNAYEDLSPVADTLYYAVRAVKLETTPGGGLFYNSSTSEIRQVIFAPGAAPTVIGLGGVLTCSQPTRILGANFSPPNCTYDWYKPDGSPNNGYIASEGGVYSVVATAPNGCTAIAYATVYMDTTLPIVNLPNTVNLTCNTPTFQFVVPDHGATIQYKLNGAAVLPGATLDFQSSSVFEIFSTANGCSKAYTVQAFQNQTPPGASATSDGNVLNCAHGSVQLFGNSPTSNVQFEWSANGETSSQQNPLVNAPGLYCLTVTAPNACTSTACVEVQAQSGSTSVATDILFIEGTPCSNGDGVSLLAEVTNGTPPFALLWSTGSTGAEAHLPPGFSGPITLNVTDANGCVGQAAAIVASTTEILALTQQESTPGAADGSIELLLFGGLPPFQFLWNTGATTQNLSGLGGGTYIVTVTGASGCTTTLTIPLTTVGTAETSAAFALQIAPNPAQSQFEVRFEQILPQIVTLRLTDFAGKTLATQIGIGPIFNFDTTHLPNGAYLLWLETTIGRKAHRVVVLRD
jgi:hypothetical protein